MAEYKVIFHIDEMEKWTLTLNNVRNLIHEEEGGFHIEVMANSEAVQLYKTNQEFQIKKMEKLHNEGVAFIACNNSLKAYDISQDQLKDFVHVVPAAITELVKKQQEGYAYIKP